MHENVNYVGMTSKHTYNSLISHVSNLAKQVEFINWKIEHLMKSTPLSKMFSIKKETNH